MPDKKTDLSVFEKTYHHYLNQIFSKVVKLSTDRLGISIHDNEISVDLLNCRYTISRDDIRDKNGKRPPFDICVILSRYLLTERDNYPQDKNWCSFRDLKDSNPLIHYFKTNVDNAFIKEFTGNIERLKKSCLLLGGITSNEDLNQDISLLFNVLPRVPVLLLFNDKDEEFPAACSVLFERRAENYLDAECLAMVGRFLFESVLDYC